MKINKTHAVFNMLHDKNKPKPYDIVRMYCHYCQEKLDIHVYHALGNFEHYQLVNLPEKIAKHLNTRKIECTHCDKDFVLEKSHRELIDQHFELNYPSENFVESYRRYAKSLIVIKGTSGRDKKTGLLFEFVLKNNPYELKDNTISAHLYYKKKPLKNQKVTIFSKKNQEEVKIITLVTDKEGSLEFIAEKGRDYLLDSVIITPKKGDPKKKEPIWHSVWASTTFTIPEK